MKLLGLVAILVVVAIIALQNATSVTVRFLTFETTAPLSAVIIAMAALGCAGGMLAMIPGHIRKSRELSRLKQERSDTGQIRDTGRPDA